MDTKYLKKVGAYVLSVALALVFIVYLIYHMVNGFTTDISTIAAEIQSKKSVISGDGYIFRDEHYVYSAYGGAAIYLAGDGDKVSINQALAEAFSDPAGYSVGAELTAIENKLAVLKESEVPKGAANSDTSAVDKRISSYYHLILKNIAQGKYSHAMQSTDSLLAQMNRRQIIIGEVTDFSSRTASLEAQKASLTSRLSGLKETVYSDMSGYFFSSIDGYEEAFDSNAVNNMTVTSFHQLISSSPKSPEGTGRTVIGKIATGYEWYLAIPTQKDLAEEIIIGNTYKGVFRYNYDTELTLKAEKVIAAPSGDRAVAVFSCGDMPEGFSFLRSQSVEIILSESKGYRVPKTAVRLLDGYEGVYTLYGSTVVFKRIDILLEVEGHYIVSTVDPLAPKEKDGEETEETEETTTAVETTADTSNETAATLPYGYLALYDRIITSGKDLQSGMVFY